MTTHRGVIELVDETAAAFVERVTRDVAEPTERFPVFRRALERGAERLDTYGDMIVNQAKPETVDGLKDQLAMLYSGVLQCAVAAVAILETLPDIPISGFEIMTHDEQH